MFYQMYSFWWNIDVLKPHAGRRKGCKMAFLFLVTLIFDPDLQTHPRDEPNTSSTWIWRKSIQRSRDISYTNKKHRRRQKQNLPQFTARGNNSTNKSTLVSLITVTTCYYNLQSICKVYVTDQPTSAHGNELLAHVLWTRIYCCYINRLTVVKCHRKVSGSQSDLRVYSRLLVMALVDSPRITSC